MSPRDGPETVRASVDSKELRRELTASRGLSPKIALLRGADQLIKGLAGHDLPIPIEPARPDLSHRRGRGRLGQGFGRVLEDVRGQGWYRLAVFKAGAVAARDLCWIYLCTSLRRGYRPGAALLVAMALSVFSVPGQAAAKAPERRLGIDKISSATPGKSAGDGQVRAFLRPGPGKLRGFSRSLAFWPRDGAPHSEERRGFRGGASSWLLTPPVLVATPSSRLPAAQTSWADARSLGFHPQKMSPKPKILPAPPETITVARSNYRRVVAGQILMGLGLVGMLVGTVGLVFAAQSTDEYQALKKVAPRSPEQQKRWKKAKQRRQLGFSLAIGGYATALVSLITGPILVASGRRREAQRRVSLRPAALGGAF